MGHRFIAGSCRRVGDDGRRCTVPRSRAAEPCVDGEPAAVTAQLELEPQAEEDDPAEEERVEEGGHDRQEKKGRRRAKKVDPAGDEDGAA